MDELLSKGAIKIPTLAGNCKEQYFYFEFSSLE
jgi:hypothetical protein